MPNAPRRLYPDGTKPGYRGDATLHPLATLYVGDLEVRFVRRERKGQVRVRVVGRMRPSAQLPRQRELVVPRAEVTREWRAKPARRGLTVPPSIKRALAGLPFLKFA